MLADRLGNWVDGDGPLQELLAAGIARLIARGELRPGDRLPTERALAADLAVSRTTVVNAYERLKSTGLLAARQGSGTWVKHPPKSAQPGLDSLPATLRLGRLRPRHDGRGIIDLATGVLGATPQVRREFEALLADPAALDEALASPGYHPAGLGELRAAIADRLTSEGIETTRADLVITSGAQQAFSLIAAALLHPGDTVAVENPTHPGALDVWRGAGARLVDIACDDHGVRPDDARVVLERDRPRLLYVTPTFQNPTGGVMPLAHREAIARYARSTGTLIVEDDSLRELNLAESHIPRPIASLDPERTLLVGSMSKLWWAGLRIGWIRAPAEIRNRLVTLKTRFDLGTAVLDQLMAARLLPHGEAVGQDRTSLLRPRLETLCSALHERLPNWTFAKPAGGSSVWVCLPTPTAAVFAATALHDGVAVGPGPVFSHDLNGFEDHIQLSFTQTPDELVAAIDRLRTAWGRHERSSPRPSTPLAEREAPAGRASYVPA